MSDWELDTGNEPPKSMVSKKPSSDWELAEGTPEKKEGFGTKLARDVAVGFANRGHSLLNTPHDLAKNIEQQGRQFNQLIDKGLNLEKYGLKSRAPSNSLADKIPFQEEKNFAEMLGQKGQGTLLDKAIQKGVEYAPELLMGANIFRTHVPHLTKRGASKNLNQARQLGVDRNMRPLNINPELIEDTRQFLPNTTPYRNALEAAKTGEYEPLFNLQSDVGNHANEFARSLFSAAERSHGRAGFNARNALLEDIHNELQSAGHHDISALLRQGQNDYRRYMKFKPYRNTLILAGLGGLALPRGSVNMAKKIWLHKKQ